VELAGVAALLLVALMVRAYNLEHIPANLGGDEGTWAMQGLAMLDGRLANPFATRWFAFPSMSFLVWGLSMRLFGETVAGVRAASALIGTASVLSTFLLARELWGRRLGPVGSGREAMGGGGLGAGRIAWFAAGALAVGHYHIHFSRLAVNNIADSLFVTLSLYLLVRGLESDRSILFALAGAVIGVGWYGYFGARLVGIIAALYVIWRAVVENRFLAHHGHHLLILLGAALVVAAPLLLHYAVHPSALSEGVNRVGILTSGWLAREQEATGRSATSLLLEQFWKSISAFNYTLDPTFWYKARIPLLDVVSGLFFVFGLIWCTARAHRSSNVLLLIWFWSALVTGWVMTENPPSSQRLVIAAPALALFVALGLDRLLHLTRYLLGLRCTLRCGIAGLVFVAMVGLNVGYYFFVYTPSRVYGNPTAEMTTRLARYLARQNDECVVYLHGPPFVYWDFGTLRFMAWGITGVDVPSPDEGEAPEPDLSRGARFVFHPARADELSVVRARYPGGKARSAHSYADGELLYAMYEVGP
jgi:4-amino-4-deoxy-L-arabinose transferase-like glycosyltransferase